MLSMQGYLQSVTTPQYLSQPGKKHLVGSVHKKKEQDSFKISVNLPPKMHGGWDDEKRMREAYLLPLCSTVKYQLALYRMPVCLISSSLPVTQQLWCIYSVLIKIRHDDRDDFIVMAGWTETHCTAMGVLSPLLLCRWHCSLPLVSLISSPHT